MNCRPVLLVPRFGLDDGSASDFEATLVLATMTVSQLADSNDAQQPATSAQHNVEPRAATTPSVSNHTKIWSELSGLYLPSKMFFLSYQWYGHTTCMRHVFLCPSGHLCDLMGTTAGPKGLYRSIMATFGALPLSDQRPQ